MNLALLLTLAGVDNNTSGGGPLTLVFPLVLVFVVAALWWLSMRHSGSE
jgi:hypothetical protein